MVSEIRWTKYFWLSILSFGAFMLEYLSIIIEVILLHVDIQNYTAQQRSIHHIIMVFMWSVFIGVLLFFPKALPFPDERKPRGQDFREKLDSNACLLHWL